MEEETAEAGVVGEGWREGKGEKVKGGRGRGGGEGR